MYLIESLHFFMRHFTVASAAQINASSVVLATSSWSTYHQPGMALGTILGKSERERPEWSRVSSALNGFSPLCQMSFAAVCCGRLDGGGGGLSGAYLDSFMGGSRRQSHEPPELPHQTGDIALHKRQQKMLSS